MREHPTRRRFLVRAGLAVLGGPGLLACADRAAENARLAERARELSRGLDCTDTTGLQEAERLTRETNAYREQSDRPGQYCFGCENYQPPEQPGNCATCKTVKGPINPAGWCESWVAARR